MGDSHIHSSEGPVDLLTTAREWLWRHSSQPNGDPWDGARSIWIGQRLLSNLVQWLSSLDTQLTVSRTSH